MTSDQSSSERSATEYRVLRILCAGIFVAELVRTAWLSPDSYIQLRTVQNFVSGLGLTFNHLERVQSAGAPLWSLALSIPAIVGVPLPMAALILAALFAVATFVLIQREARSVPSIFLALFLALGSRACIDYSTSGLENALTSFIAALLAFELLKARDGAAQRIGTLAAAASLSQLSTLLLAAPALFRIFRTGDRSVRKAALFGLWPLLMWALFALWYYGFILSAESTARFSAGAPGWEFTKQGVLYLLDLALHDPLSAFILGAAVVFPWISGATTERLLSAGIALQLGAVVLMGGDADAGRLVSAPLTVAILLAVRRCADLSILTQRGLVLLAVIGGLMASGSNFTSASLLPETTRRPSGILDARRAALGESSASAFSRSKDQAPSDSEGKLARQQVVSLDVPGPTAFLSGRSFHAIAPDGSTDPLLSRLPIDPGPWEIGELKRTLPPGYIESVKTGSSLLAEQGLRRYYSALLPVVRGPLWKIDRLESILAFHTGAYDHLLAPYYEGAPKEVSVAALAQPKGRGNAWNAYGSIPILSGGVEIVLEKPHQAIGLDLSIGSSGIYELSFFLGRDLRGSETVKPTALQNGELVGAQIHIPEEVIESGFDRIRIVSANGSPKSSVGHLILIE